MKSKAPIGSIKPNPNNPRIIKDDKFRKLVQSLKDFPVMTELREVLLDENNIIIGGNMRYKAAKTAGWKDIPVKYFTREDAIRNNELTKQNKTYEEYIEELVIKDNVSGGEWDWDILANDYDPLELDNWGLDLPDKTILEPEIQEDEAPEVSSKPLKSKLGEIYQLGKHRLMCGDSTDKANVELLMNGNKVDMVFTDPPYGMDLDADYSQLASGNSYAKGKKHDKVIGDDQQFDMSQFSYIDCKEQFWFGADYYIDTLPNYGKDGSWLVWDKRASESQDKGFGSNFELLWSKQKHKRLMLRHEWFGFFTGGEKREYEHPTTKPVKLLAQVLDKWGKSGNIVLDLFSGSGSGLIACEQTGRIFYGMELDPKYCDVIRKRYWKFTHDNNEEGWEDGTPVIL